MRVLLIDDDEEEYFLLREMISSACEASPGPGFDLSWVSTYDQALKALANCSHDVFLVDYQLGGSSGLDLLRNTADRDCRAPVIMLTGRDDQAVDLAAMELGASGYLVKGQLNWSLLERSIRYALEQRQVQADLQNLVQERSALQKAISSLLSTLDLSRLLGQILDAAREAIPAAEEACLALIEQPGNRSNRLAEMKHDDPRIVVVPLSQVPEGLVKALSHGHALLISDLEDAPLLLPLFQNHHGSSARSALIAPLVMGREVVGAMTLIAASPAAFTEAQRDPVTTFATTATAALQNAIIYSEARDLATTDPLTAVWNRRALSDLGQRELERSTRFRRPLSAIVFDVDGFKAVNDKYGHAAGDQVLTGIVERCRGSIRHIDILARLGGDEFAILLPEADQQLAGEIAKRVRLSVSGFPMQTNDGPITVFISMGVAQVAPDMQDLEALLDKADRALYHSKQAGRNTVSILP